MARRKDLEHRLRSAIQQDLAAGDRIVGGAKVVVANQAGRAGPLTAAAVADGLVTSGTGIGQAIGRMRTVTGGPESVAMAFPRLPTAVIGLYVTEQELVATHGISEPEIVWRVPVDRVVDVHKSPRVQVMARFRVSFDDESSLVFLTFRARTVRRIRRWLDRSAEVVT